MRLQQRGLEAGNPIRTSCSTQAQSKQALHLPSLLPSLNSCFLHLQAQGRICYRSHVYSSILGTNPSIISQAWVIFLGKTIWIVQFKCSLLACSLLRVGWFTQCNELLGSRPVEREQVPKRYLWPTSLMAICCFFLLLLCHTTCGILVSNQGLNSGLGKHRVLTTGPPGIPYNLPVIPVVHVSWQQR